MAKYRRANGEEVEATQWFKAGDNPRVVPWETSEGVRGIGGWGACLGCGVPVAHRVHGYMVDGGGTVCPGDWIVEGEASPINPTVFAATYGPVGVAVKFGDWVEQTEDGLVKCEAPTPLEDAPDIMAYVFDTHFLTGAL